jgi:pilus assembly protein CpaD
MSRLTPLAVLLLGGAALAGCSSTGNSTQGANRSVDSLNQPVVQRTDFTIDLATNGEGLSPAERGRLESWFNSLRLGYGDRISVDEAYGPSQSREDVAHLAAEYGLLLSESTPITAGQVEPGSLRVIISRSTASVPNCPNWQGPGGPSATSPNYGCATNSNLAAMIADPSDLVLGQTGSGRDNATSGKAIRLYREAKPTGANGLNEASSKGGN